MIYKRKNLWLKTILSTVFILSFSSCSDFLQGKPKRHDYIEVKKENLICLKNISSQIKRFFKSEATSADIDAAFTCLDETLLELQTRVQGTTDRDSFSNEDTFKIFDQFLNEAKISKETANEILKLKTALLGGSELKITKVELSSLRDLLKIIKTEVYQLLPYATIYSFKKGNNELSKDKIASAFKQLSLSLNKIFISTQLVRSDYKFDDFKKLVLNLNIFGSDSGELFDLAFEIKNLLLGSETLQSSTDYQAFIFSVTEILRLYSIQNQGYVTFEIQNKQQMKEAIEFIEEWLAILENSIQYKRSEVILSETLDPLIAKIAAKNILPVKLNPKTLIEFYKIILVRVFDAGLNGDPHTFSGLRKLQFVNIKRELAIFKIYLSSINSLSFPDSTDPNTDKRINISEAQAALKKFDYSFQNSSLSLLETTEKDLVLSAVEELRFEFLTARPVVYRFNKMVIAANQNIWKQSWQDLARAAYIKFLGRELLLGWGNSGTTKLVQNAFITESGLIKWYAEFKQFCIEIKLFDPRAINSGSKSFKEANLFPYSADGNDKMSFLETVQYLNILATGGGQIFGEIKKGLTKAGCNLKEKDAFGFFWNQESCVYSDFRINYKNYFNNLSYLVGYLDHLDEQQFLSFYESVMMVARNDQRAKGKIESADLRNFIILMHYAESLYAEFDKDWNWTISAAEMRAGYSRFKNFATDFAHKTAKDKINIFNSAVVQNLGYGCYSEEDLIRESFIYLVYNGTPPGMTDLNIVPCFTGKALIDFSGEVDRKTIINTFKVLKAILGS